MFKVHRGNLEELVKAILSMPPPKKTEPKPVVTQLVEEPLPVQKPSVPAPKDEDRIDFVNVKDLIKGMERQKQDPKDYLKENGFQRHIDNGHDSDKKIEDDADNSTDKAEEKTDMSDKSLERSEKSFEKTESSDSSESLSRSNSLINGASVQVPKPLPRSSISEAGSADDHFEVPKPKPRTTAIPVSGYKVTFGLRGVESSLCGSKVVLTLPRNKCKLGF